MVKRSIFDYALAGGYYLLSNLNSSELKKIKNVIIFGSVATNTSNEESDIDIFFDVNGSKKFQSSLRSKLNKIIDDFYLTSVALSYKIKLIDNEFSIKVGILKEWEDLARSIASNGIIIYGKFTKTPPKIKAYTILSWEKPGKSKGAISNKIYGYKSGEKRYLGILKKYSGIKIGPATIMIPAIQRDIFIDTLEKYGVNYSRFDIWK